MKKTLLLAGVAGALLAHNAQAEDLQKIKPVVGIDYVFSQIDMDDGNDELLESELNAFAVSVGARFNKYAGFEVFYQQSEDAEKNIYADRLEALSSKVQYKIQGIDIIGYAPVNNNMDFVGSVGITYSKADYSFTYLDRISGIAEEIGKDSQKKFGFRLGAGTQYNINEHLSLRLMGRYNYTGIVGAKNMFDITAGVRFYL